MGIVIEPIEAYPAYNGVVVAEPIELATSVDQYWRERRNRYETAIQAQKVRVQDPAPEREWQQFCRSGAADFLGKYIRTSIGLLREPLLQLWAGRSSMVRETQQILERGCHAEIWVPISLYPLKFVSLTLGRQNPDIKEISHSERPENYVLGRSHVILRWQDKLLFVVLPHLGFVEVNTFVFEDNQGTGLTTGDILPKVFSETLREFRANLESIEKRFAPVRAIWEAREQASLATRQLALLDSREKAWRKVQIPDGQKLDILRRMDLFESGDAAAPHGLLLFGPTGSGKSLIARTIAETSDCNFQKLSLPDLKKQEIGASGTRVREIWDHARAHRPAVIFIDECDAVFGQRGSAATDIVAADVVQSFLPEWDGIEETTGIMVIGATNRRHSIDPAILSRFGWELEIGLQSSALRRNILQQELQARGITLELTEEVDVLTQGMSGRALRNLASAAKSLAHPDSPTVDHLYEAAKAARSVGGPLVNSTKTWETLPLDEAHVDRLKVIGELLRSAERWESNGVGIPKSILLTGADVGMKRQIAEALANESGLMLISPTLSDLKDPTLAESGNRVRRLFDQANSAIVFFDRLDSMMPNRGMIGAMDPLTNEIIGQFTQEYESLLRSSKCVFLIGGASTPSQIDPEVLGCFEEQMDVGIPDRNGRFKLFMHLLSAKKLSFSLEEGAFFLTQLTEDRAMDTRGVENFVRTAEQKALLRAMKNGGPESFSIALDDFGIPKP